MPPPQVSFADVFQTQLPFVWRVLRSFGAPLSDLEDLCQDVFVVVHRRLHEFEGRAALSSWLYAISWRIWQDHRRRAYHRYEQMPGAVPELAAAPTQSETTLQNEAWRQLADILGQLDDDKRAVFVLYEIEQLPMKEVAQAVNCPVQTAYTRLHAARDLVREAWQRKYGDRQDG